MLLAIDIGNTNINLGVFRGLRLIRRYAFPTPESSYAVPLSRIFRKNRVKDIIICSVVPKVTGILAQEIKKVSDGKIYIIGKDIRVPIRNLYRNPRQVGQDRLVNAYAGVVFYGAPLVAVDFGTAITFDLISKDKEYLGGMILPGLKVSLDALAKYTALLPKIKLARPKEFIGRDTENSMLSGIVYGFAALTDDLAIRMKKQIGRKAKVIATGGNVALISRYCRRIDKVDKDLILKGLSLIYRGQFFHGTRTVPSGK